METLGYDLSKGRPGRETYLSIGVFDGVHLGHLHLIDILVREAAKADCIPGVVTFRNHPREVLDHGLHVSRLTTEEERERLLRQAGIEVVIPVTFTREVSLITASDFTASLQRQLGMRGLVVGSDFALGHNREGTPDFLKDLGEEQGFAVKVADDRTVDWERVSSTVIREALAQGDVGGATRLLGRRHTLTGDVVHGESRGGSLLGYPTANINVDGGLVIPMDGIYATWVYVGEKRYQAATSIGVRPTFGKGERTIEAFLLDFQGDLYGKRLRLEFVERLRDEVGFDSAETLRAQIELDVETTRQVLSLSE